MTIYKLDETATYGARGWRFSHPRGPLAWLVRQSAEPVAETWDPQAVGAVTAIGVEVRAERVEVSGGDKPDPDVVY